MWVCTFQSVDTSSEDSEDLAELSLDFSERDFVDPSTVATEDSLIREKRDYFGGIGLGASTSLGQNQGGYGGYGSSPSYTGLSSSRRYGSRRYGSRRYGKFNETQVSYHSLTLRQLV